MIKVGQIIDRETKGLMYLETSRSELLVIPQLRTTEAFIAEVIRFDETDTPVEFIKEIEVTIDLNNRNGLSIREIIQAQI